MPFSRLTSDNCIIFIQTIQFDLQETPRNDTSLSFIMPEFNIVVFAGDYAGPEVSPDPIADSWAAMSNSVRQYFTVFRSTLAVRNDKKER